MQGKAAAGENTDLRWSDWTESEGHVIAPSRSWRTPVPLQQREIGGHQKAHHRECPATPVPAFLFPPGTLDDVVSGTPSQLCRGVRVRVRKTERGAETEGQRHKVAERQIFIKTERRKQRHKDRDRHTQIWRQRHRMTQTETQRETAGWMH